MSEQADTQMKRPWREPALIVLMRGKAEESVLVGCEGDGVPTSSLKHFAGCHSDSNPCVLWCSDQSGS